MNLITNHDCGSATVAPDNVLNSKEMPHDHL